MPLAPGTRFGPYEIATQIGAGGMGEVYRATDTHLSRNVAIKVLPQAVAADGDRLARFDREARTLAALNHPNIAAIYGVEKGQGTTALVMELVEGPTLADRIMDGAIPVEETLRIARQIADALEAAHDQGIVHRDLKPANIKLRKDGTVKVLDFGLAKTTAAAPEPSALASASPTLTSPAMTEAGVIFGTAAYMSPEQAKGQAVDQRTDVWAFACVLYEMLTGRRAFAATTVTETLAAILERDVDWSRLPASTPPGVRRMMRRALAKDPRRRVHHIADARLDLDEAHATPEPIQPDSRRAPWLWIGVASIAFVAGAAGAWRLTSAASSSSITSPPARLSLVPEPALSAGAEGNVAMSPDGRHVVHVSGPAALLYVRDIDRFDARALPGTEGANSPAFSPDGKWIAFFANRKVRKVALAGGSPVTLADFAEGIGLGWQSDESIVYSPGRATGIWRVSAGGGGTPQQVTRLRPGENSHRDPEGLPGGTAILYSTNGGAGIQEIFAESLATGERHLVDRGANPHYIRTGHIAYVQGGALMVVPFDVVRLEKTGTPSVVLTDVRQTSLNTAQIAFSQTGSMIYVPAGAGGRRDTLVWVDPGGAEHPTMVSGEAFLMPRLSPDLRRVAVAIGDGSAAQGAQGDLWMYDLAGGQRSRLTFDGLSTFPLWEPGGRRLAFSSGQSGKFQVLLKTLDGTAADASLLTERGTNYPLSWSPDSKFVATVSVETETANDIWVVTLGTSPQWRPFVRTKLREGAPTFSHDNRLMAYASDLSGRNEIYVLPFPGGGEAVPISTDGGSEPLFASGSPTLFYRHGDDLMAVEITPGPPITVGSARLVFQKAYNRSNGFWPNYDVTPDGKRVLMIRGTAQDIPSRVNVVFNWLDATP